MRPSSRPCRQAGTFVADTTFDPFTAAAEDVPPTALRTARATAIPASATPGPPGEAGAADGEAGAGGRLAHLLDREFGDARPAPVPGDGPSGGRDVFGLATRLAGVEARLDDLDERLRMLEVRLATEEGLAQALAALRRRHRGRDHSSAARRAVTAGRTGAREGADG